ncbi:MAG TPA: rRNA adenine methyltransferase, partial [Puia sp.]|nr:rRNA adenine methyltransferase [Puia sp.]
MLYDPSNPMVRLCVEGMETEWRGEAEKAAALYHEAWALAANELEYATAAHYLARVQTDPAEALRWNLLALEYAEKLTDDEA